MSVVNGQKLIQRYEIAGNWDSWSNDDKELLLFALYTVYRKYYRQQPMTKLYTLEQIRTAFSRTVLDYPTNKQDEDWAKNEYPKLEKYFIGQLEEATKEN